MKRSHVLAGFLALLAALSPFTGLLPGWTPGLATNVALTALSLLGLNLIFGVTGMLAFGQAALMTVPAYAAGILIRLGLPAWPAILIGLLVGLLVARLLAGLFVRLPGIFLAVGTLGFGFVTEGLARAFPAWTGGASGLVFDSSLLFGPGRSLGGTIWYGVALVALAIGLFVWARSLRGATWRRLRTIRHDELVAGAMGIDVARAKARAFTAGSAYAVVAGMLLAWYIGVVVPENAGVERSLEQIGMVMMGGPALLIGPLVGALLVDVLFVLAGYGERLELLIYGAVFLAAVIYAPHGLVGWLVAPWRRLCRRLDGPPAPAPLHSAPPPPSHPAGLPCLEVTDLGKRFGGLLALENISFSVASGEIFALVGPNGAGKSTLFNLISGILPPSTGRILISGQDMAGRPLHDRAALVGRSFQVARLVPELSAVENVMVRLDGLADAPADPAARAAMARAQLADFGFLSDADQPVAALSLGQHKLIDLARAAIGRPPLVLLDEPAVGLSPDELAHLGQLLVRLREGGCAVVIVEHNIDFLASVATSGLVLDSGRKVAQGPIADILADPAVHEAYFGALA